MKITIVGDGKVGMTLIDHLSREGHDVVVIDSNPKVLNQTLEKFDVMVIEGNGATMNVLRRAGIEDMDLLIAVTNADEINLLSCITAKKMGNVSTIARVRNPEYTEQLTALREELGLSLTVNPERAAAHEAYRQLQLPSFLKRETFAKGRVEIVELRIKGDSQLKGVALSKLYQIAGVKVLVCAVDRGGQVFIPGGDFVLEENDRIYITAQTQNLAKLTKNLKISTQKIQEVMIVGGSKIAHYLAEYLLKSGIRVKIIEKDHNRCLQLAEALPRASIIEADGSTQEVLVSEGIAETDAVVTLTNMDEGNLIISMFATSVGVPNVITKINRLEYPHLFTNLGVGSVISPRELCSAQIVQYVRAMQNTTGGGVLTLHRIVSGKAEALEFRVDSTTRHRDKPLKDIPIKDNTLIACIMHDVVSNIPDGSSSFTEGDTVVVVTTSERPFHQLNDIFAD